MNTAMASTPTISAVRRAPGAAGSAGATSTGAAPGVAPCLMTLDGTAAGRDVVTGFLQK